MDFEYFFELFLGGLTRGSIYALIALGYTMVYGIIELINFAHGEIYMIGAFTGLIVASVLTLLGWNPGHSGDCLHRCRRLLVGLRLDNGENRLQAIAQAPRLSALISAIGMSLFLQNYVLLAQTSDFLPFPNLIPDFEFMEPMLTSSVRSGAGDLISSPPSSWSLTV
jgi:branched-chain amino acid transport system permease protein